MNIVLTYTSNGQRHRQQGIWPSTWAAIAWAFDLGATPISAKQIK